MSQEIVLQRGKRAGIILLIQAAVYWVLIFLQDAAENGLADAFLTFVDDAFILVIYFALTAFIADGLKSDRIKRIRILYIILSCLATIGIFYAFSNGSEDDLIVTLLDTAKYILIIIALYHFGKPGKICCYVAVGLAALSLLFSLRNGDLDFPNFVSSGVQVVYYIFLGLYIESKAFYDEDAAEEPPERTPPAPEPTRDGYDELIRLKDLMDRGVITPAEYEAKKKQILGL